MRNYDYHTTYNHIKMTMNRKEIEKHYIDNFNVMNNQKHIEFKHS